MIFFEVPTAAALSEAEANKDKVIRKPNRFYVQVHSTQMTFNTNAATVKQFPVVNIQAGKSVHIDLQIPIRTYGRGGLCINTSVKVNGQTWYNLGNSGYTGGETNNGVRHIDLFCETKVLDLVTGLGLDPLSDYNLQFYITARTYSGAGYINKYCAVNTTGVGAKGSRSSIGSNQNYVRLIVQEMD